MWNSLIDTGDPGVQILQAYLVKLELRSLLLLAGTNLERHLVGSGHVQSSDQARHVSEVASNDLDVRHCLTDDIQLRVALAPDCLLYTSPSPRDGLLSRMPSSA